MQSALAHLPPPDQPTNEAERRSYDTSHLNENDAILRHSGDDAEVPDDYDDNSFRVYFQNVNGLKMMQDDESVISAVGFLASFRASVACFAETNVNWRKDNVYSRVQQQFRRCFQSVKLKTSSSGLKSQSINQQGGTCTAVLGKWCARKASSGNSASGSFSWVRMRGRRGRFVTLITCYRVSQTSGVGLGDATAFVQQETLLRSAGVQVPKPKRHIMKEITEFVTTSMEKGDEIVLSLDANDELDGNANDFTAMVASTGLIDIIAETHGEVARTSLRGRRRIDYILVSPGITHAVQKCGQIGIQDAILSDHSGCWVEFDGKKLFNGATEGLSSVLQLPFTMRETVKLEKFTTALEDHLSAKNVENRLETLRRIECENGFADENYIALYESIATDVDAAMQAGINAAKRSNVGYARSPALTEAASLVRYWRTLLSARRNSIGLSAGTIEFGRRHDLPTIVPGANIINTNLHGAWEHLRKVQTEAAERRSAWLHSQAEEAALELNTTKKAALRQIALESTLKATFRKLRPIAKGPRSGALSRIKVPLHEWMYHQPSDTLYRYIKGAFYSHARVTMTDGEAGPFHVHRTRQPLPKSHVCVANVRVDPTHIHLDSTAETDNIWREVVDSEELVQLLLERNAEHLRQSTIDGTPFASGPLNQLFGLFGTNDQADAILNGTLDIENLNLSDEVKAWLQELAYDDGAPPPVEVSITSAQFSQSVKRCNVNTSASPSGFGYLIWKASGLSPMGARVHSTMMTLPFSRGFAPSRWKQCLEVMLEKDAGNPMIHRLRIIVLLEADFNIALRIIWMRRLFPAAERMGFTNDQWGNRKMKSATDCLSMKLLSFESKRHTRTCTAIMAMDAAACYDRILTYLSNICERRHGLPKTACHAKGKTVFEMLRKVRTAYGESDEYYTSMGDDLMHGECQGKTSSPPSWAIYTITMLRAMKKFNPGISIACVEGERTVHRLADMFVDDCDMWTASTRDDSNTEVDKMLADFKRAAQAWERILFATGGLLALHKCYWWVVAWRWENGLPVMASEEDLPASIQLTNGNDPTAVKITRLGPDDANVGLGFRMTPSGNQQLEIRHRTKQSNQLAARINTTLLNPPEAWVLYSSIYIPKVYYPCKISTFTRSQWTDVTRSATGAFLSRMGFNRNTSRRAMYGPARLGGAGLTHGYARQGAESVTHFLTHIRWNSELGKVMLNVLDQLQLLSGRGTALLEAPEPLPTRRPNKRYNILYWYHLGPGWFVTMRDFLHYIHGSILIPGAWKPLLTRENDVAIMDAIIEDHSPTQYQLAMVNSVRMWLRVITLSDITDIEGRFITPWARGGTKRQESSLKWPRQSRPTPGAIALWRKYITTSFGNSNNKHNSTEAVPLETHLGQWTSQPHILHEYYWDSTTLYVRQDNDFRAHLPLHERNRAFARSSTPTELPQHATPVKAMRLSSFLYITSLADPIPIVSPTIFSRNSYLDVCPPQERRIIGRVPEWEHIRPLLRLIGSGSVEAATDGSHDPHLRRATGSWILSTRDGKLSAKGVCPVDGDLETLDSYRAELDAIRCLLYYLRFLTRTRQIQPADQWCIKLWVDNKEALDKTSWQKLAIPKQQLCPESDIVADIIAVRLEIELTFLGYHVHSHQNQNANQPTPLEVVLNEECDETAKHYLHNANPEWRTLPTASPPPTAIASLFITNKLITNNHHHRLTYAWSSIDMTTYLLERNAWSQQTFDMVDWEHLEVSILPIKQRSKSEFARYIKFMIDMQNTGRQKHRFTSDSTSTPTTSNVCPCCKTVEETTMHLYQCNERKVHDLVTRGLASLLDALQKRHISADIWYSMQAGINSFRNSTDPQQHTARSDAIGIAYDQQTRIGWNNFLKGRVSQEWGNLMLHEYQQAHKGKRYESRRRFQTALITNLWQLYSSLWKHRNTTHHDHADITSLSNVDLNSKIRFYYTNRHTLLGIGDQDRFSMGILTALHSSVTQKQNWLITMAIRVKAHIKETASLLSRIPTLHTHFT